jgi:hypothetical protein
VRENLVPALRSRGDDGGRRESLDQLDERLGDCSWCVRRERVSLCDVQRLDNGDTMVTASVSGLMQRVTPDGAVPWELSLGAGGRLFAFAGHYTSPYEPTSAPD